jgi:hypothetical protein
LLFHHHFIPYCSFHCYFVSYCYFSIIISYYCFLLLFLFFIVLSYSLPLILSIIIKIKDIRNFLNYIKLNRLVTLILLINYNHVTPVLTTSGDK